MSFSIVHLLYSFFIPRTGGMHVLFVYIFVPKYHEIPFHKGNLFSICNQLDVLNVSAYSLSLMLIGDCQTLPLFVSFSFWFSGTCLDSGNTGRRYIFVRIFLQTLLNSLVFVLSRICVHNQRTRDAIKAPKAGLSKFIVLPVGFHGM